MCEAEAFDWPALEGIYMFNTVFYPWLARRNKLTQHLDNVAEEIGGDFSKQL